jgi:outer membrane protein OmpA-like peptidoglycan-associated protein
MLSKRRGLWALRALASAALCCAALGAGASAQSQALPKVNIQHFRPAPGPADYLSLYGTGLTGHLDWTAGFYLNYADAPLSQPGQQSASTEVVDYQLTGDAIASFGLYDVVELGLAVPVTLLQGSDDLRPLVNPEFNEDLKPAALNDLRLNVKGELRNLLTGVGLAGVLVFYVPTGDTGALGGDGGFNMEARWLTDFLLPHNIRLGVNLGYRYRQQARRVREAFVGNEALLGLGAAVPLWAERIDGYVEIHGALAVSAGPVEGEEINEGASPAELLGGVRYAITPDLTLTVGVGGGLTQGYGAPESRFFVGIGNQWVTGGKWNWDYDFDGVLGDLDKCPRTSEDLDGFEDEDGCPDPDNDGDGIFDSRDRCPDAGVAGVDPISVGPDGCPDNDIDGDHIFNDRDKCPEDPEDFDRFEDSDGCPDIDNDGDGIPDLRDSCPDTAETFNGLVDEDGCPEDDKQKVIVTKQKIEILEPVYFDTARATIQERSFPVLDGVAEVLRRNPELLRVRIEGHTDDRGGDRYNLRLSQQRAAAVKKYLTDKGIAEDRLIPVGYGETRPLVDNKTNEDRQRNRRVEFIILDRGQPKAPDFGGDDGDEGLPF